MKNRLIIEKYVNALLAQDSAYLWEHKNLKKNISTDEKAYLKSLLLEKLQDISMNSERQSEINSRKLDDFLKEHNLEQFS